MPVPHRRGLAVLPRLLSIKPSQLPGILPQQHLVPWSGLGGERVYRMLEVSCGGGGIEDLSLHSYGEVSHPGEGLFSDVAVWVSFTLK